MSPWVQIPPPPLDEVRRGRRQWVAAREGHGAPAPRPLCGVQLHDRGGHHRGELPLPGPFFTSPLPPGTTARTTTPTLSRSSPCTSGCRPSTCPSARSSAV